MATINEKIDGMINKPFLYKNQAYLIKSYSFNEQSSVISITTDKEVIKLIFTTASEELAKFTHLQVPAAQEPTQNNRFVSILANGNATELQKILMDNIKKVQNSKSYIDQANEINNNVKTIIDIAKTEVAMINAINKA